MTETVLHLVGRVGTDVEHRQVGHAQTDLSTFRLASTPRYYDRQAQDWVDAPTTWISVRCWRTLAVHVRDSLTRGDPVLVAGKLRTEEWVSDGQQCSRMVLVATSVGHDLTRGTTVFTKRGQAAEPTDASPAPPDERWRVAGDESGHRIVGQGGTSVPEDDARWAQAG